MVKALATRGPQVVTAALQAMVGSEKTNDASLAEPFDFLRPRPNGPSAPRLGANALFLGATEVLLATLRRISGTELGAEVLRPLLLEVLKPILASVAGLRPAGLSPAVLRARNNLVFESLELGQNLLPAPLELKALLTEAGGAGEETSKTLLQRALLCKVVRGFPEGLNSNDWASIFGCLLGPSADFIGDDAELARSQVQSLFCDNPRVGGAEVASMSRGAGLALPGLGDSEATLLISQLVELSRLRAENSAEFWPDFEPLLRRRLFEAPAAFAELRSWSRGAHGAAADLPRRLLALLADSARGADASRGVSLAGLLEEVIEGEGFVLAQEDWALCLIGIEALLAALAPPNGPSPLVNDLRKLDSALFAVLCTVRANHLASLGPELLERFLEIVKLLGRLTPSENHRHALLEFVIFAAGTIARQPRSLPLWTRCIMPLKDALLPLQLDLASTALGVLQTIVADNYGVISPDCWDLLFEETLIPALHEILGEYTKISLRITEIDPQLGVKHHELVRLALNTISRVMMFAEEVDPELVPADHIADLLLRTLAVSSSHISQEIPPLFKCLLQLHVSPSNLQNLIRNFADWVAKNHARGHSLIELIEILSKILFEQRLHERTPELFPLCLRFGGALLYAPAAEFSAFTSATHHALSAFVKSTIRLVYFDSKSEIFAQNLVDAIPDLFWSKIICQKTNFLAIMHLKNLFEELAGVETRLPIPQFACLIIALFRVMELASNSHYHTLVVNNQECLYLIFLERLQSMIDTLIGKKALEHVIALAPILLQHLGIFNPNDYKEGPLVLLILLRDFEIISKIFEFYIHNIVSFSNKDHIKQSFENMLYKIIKLAPDLNFISSKSGTEFVFRILQIIEKEMSVSTAQSAVQCLLLFRFVIKIIRAPEMSGDQSTFADYKAIFLETVKILTKFEMDIDVLEELESTCREEQISFRNRSRKTHLILVMPEVSKISLIFGERNETMEAFFDCVWKRCLIVDPESPRGFKRRTTQDLDRQSSAEFGDYTPKNREEPAKNPSSIAEIAKDGF